MAHQLNEYCGICTSHLYEDEHSGVVYCPACGVLDAEYYAEVERLQSIPFQKCPHDGSSLELSHMMYIEVCPQCQYCYDVFHGKEVDYGWVYG